MKKNVLFVVDEQLVGGVSSVLKNILNILDYERLNVDVLVLHNRGEALTGKVNKNANIIYGSDFFDTIDIGINQILKSFNLKKIINKMLLIYKMKTGSIKKDIVRERAKLNLKKYDVEIAFKDGFCSLFTAYGDANKKYDWIHGDYKVKDYTSKYKATFEKVYTIFNNIVCITADVKKSFNDIYGFDEKTIVIENLVSCDEIRKKALEKTIIDFKEDRLNMICVGRLAPEKAYDRLFNVMFKLKKYNLLQNVMLYILGDGTERQRLENLLDEFKLNDNIKLLGYIENPYPYIKKSDILLLPSYHEGLGLVLYEALTLGIPTFATKLANIDNTLNKGKYGLIVDNTEDGIYNGLVKILDNPDLLKNMKENIKNYEYVKNKDIKLKIEELIGD